MPIVPITVTVWQFEEYAIIRADKYKIYMELQMKDDVNFISSLNINC